MPGCNTKYQKKTRPCLRHCSQGKDPGDNRTNKANTWQNVVQKNADGNGLNTSWQRNNQIGRRENSLRCISESSNQGEESTIISGNISLRLNPKKKKNLAGASYKFWVNWWPGRRAKKPPIPSHPQLPITIFPCYHLREMREESVVKRQITKFRLLTTYFQKSEKKQFLKIFF